jgi:hypothetical protein
MAYKKENKKMNTSKMSSAKNPKVNDEIDGSKSVPKVKKGRYEDASKKTFSTTLSSKKKIKKK